MMNRAGYEAQIADLEDAMVRCAEHRRALVLQQVTNLFLSNEGQTVGKLARLDDVLVCLTRPATADDLAKVSNALVRSRLKLPKTTRQLARHRDPSVATPILKHSSLLSEDDLIEVAEARDLEHLLAISSRTDLSEHLTTSLIMRGHTAVHTAIARNLNARLSEGAFTILLKIAERDDEMAGLLGARLDIPAGLLRKFLAMVAEKPKSAFLRAAPASIRALVEKEAPKIAIPNRDYSSAEREIAELRRTGKLNDSAINRFAVMQQMDKLTVALALASGTSVKSIERLLYNRSDVDQLLMACKASRLCWATTLSILKSREGCAPPEGAELKALSSLFESLSLSEAQRTIRFGRTAKQ
jgi:uncharacterized protein (DUF2336 family)